MNVKANGSAFQTYLFEAAEGGEADKISYAQGFDPPGAGALHRAFCSIRSIAIFLAVLRWKAAS